MAMISIALCDDTLVEEFDKDQARIDNLFLDFYMKKLNGAETALQIRQFNDK
jgi:CheY-like chemotaxis protein